MTQLERVHFIYQCLEKEPLTVGQLHERLLSRKVDIGQRQIYHDLEQISAHYLRADEQLVFSKGQYNQKLYRLLLPSAHVEMTARDITTFQLTRNVIPRHMHLSRAESLAKFRTVYRNFIKTNSAFYAFMSEEQNVKSWFHEALYDETYNQTLDDMVWCIANHKKLLIQEVEGDTTGVRKEMIYPVLFKTLLLIFHRGNHYLGGYSEEGDTFLTIDISKIRQYQLTGKSFPHKKLFEQAKADLHKRFGIGNNIDNRLYDIELEFLPVVGEFISHYFWQHTQKFRQMDNGSWRMQMRCGINRELLSWLFQWMDNVTVIAPKKLADMYTGKLAELCRHSSLQLREENQM